MQFILYNTVLFFRKRYRICPITVIGYSEWLCERIKVNVFRCCINDDFVHEISNNFSQLQFIVSESGRIPRQIGRICVKKRDIVKHSGEDRWYRLSAISRQSDVSGQICLDIRIDPSKSSLFIKYVVIICKNWGYAHSYKIFSMQDNKKRQFRTS